MKTKFLAIILIVLMTSCSKIFYQMYNTTIGDNMTINEDIIIYQDEYCKVSYNLWSENGNIGFILNNTTDTDIYLVLDECYFIRNGIANDYFQNRSFTQSGSTSISLLSYYWSGISSSKITGVTHTEKKEICIPSGTYKTIAEYAISDIIYRDCDLLRSPRKRKPSEVKFNNENSPLTFSNRLTYRVEPSGIIKKIRNEFYVSQISNYVKDDFVKMRYIEFCDQRTNDSETFYNFSRPDKFYNKYKITNSLRH